MKLTNKHALYIEFAIGCAYRVLPKFEEKYADNDKPRKALIAAWNFLVKPTEKNKQAADAASAAADAAYAASAYAAAASAAADAASAAASAAAAAYAAAASAAAAAYAAAVSAAERKWQMGLLFALNVKYKLSVKIKGVE